MKTFKQKAVFSAVASASLLLAGGAGAVNINNDGLGEALIYPYYTVRAGTSTLISVVNTTTTSKSVKVRFNEGKNSAEVLDFNLFLSPKDVWTGAVIATADGAGLVTADKSCTNPKITGTVAFRNTAYLGDIAALRTLDRTREGYVEILEMATITKFSPTDNDVTHNSAGVPTCLLVSNAAVAANAADYNLPTGGLFGNGTLVGNSMSTGYNATALEGLGYTGGPTASGTVLPNLTSGSNTTAVVVTSPSSGTTKITTAGFVAAIDAVSAVLMHSSAMGEYSYDATFSTDWVATMPTKRFYVNGTLPIPPFQRIWNGRTTSGNGTACVDITIASFDREEGSSTFADDFSPTGDAGVPQLCFEATVVSFDTKPSTDPSSVVGSTNNAHFAAYQSPAAAGGWAEMTFGNAATFTPTLSTPNGLTTLVTSTGVGASVASAVTFTGLPTIGFSIVAAKFATARENFNSSYNLNFRRKISP